MGSVSTQDMFGVINKDPVDPVVTPVPQPKLAIPDLVQLPLVIVKGNFRCLDKLDGDELEDFLRYLCRFTAAKEQRSRFAKPTWWCEDTLPFCRHFAKGSKLPHVKDKDRKMRGIINTAYHYYSSKDLLQLSSKFSEPHIVSLDFKTCYDGSVVVLDKGYHSAIVRIPASNMKYDHERMKKISKEVNVIEVITIDDESPKKKILTEVQKLAAVRPPHFKINGSALLNASNLNSKKENPISSPKKYEPDVTIVLTDSDDDNKKSNISEIKESAPTRRSRKRLLNDNKSPKKKIRLFDRLNSLQQTGSISYYPCITISDYEEEDNESDDCQIINVYEPETNSTCAEIKDIYSLSTGNASEFEKNNFPRSKRRRKSKEEESDLKKEVEISVNNCNSLIDFIKQSSITEEPRDEKPADQENFLAYFCLIKQEKFKQVQSYVAPLKKLRRLRLPLYHMPLDLLPALVARGVISASHLEHNYKCDEVVPKEKLKRLRKPTIRYRLPPGIHLKQCSVVLKRLPNDFLLDMTVKLKDCK